MNHFRGVRERKLYKKEGDGDYRRTISIRNDRDLMSVVEVHDSHLRPRDSRFADLGAPNAPKNETFHTVKRSPPLEWQAAIDHANECFQNSIEFQEFIPAPPGTDFL